MTTSPALRIAVPPPRLREGGPPQPPAIAARIERLSLYYGDKQALKSISMTIPRHRVTAFIGPSGCGKTTLLRCLNRMNDLVEDVRIEGKILVGDLDVHAPGIDVTSLRKRVGMVFQKSTPFPKSIFDNVAYGPRVLGARSRSVLEPLVENSLKHGCSPGIEPLHLALEARTEDGWLTLVFSDDGERNGHDKPGLGFGLQNLEQRVRRFAGADASMTAQTRPDGGFEVRMRWRNKAVAAA